MKKILTFAIFALLTTLTAVAYDVVKISHANTEDYANLAEIDSIYFDESQQTLFIQPVSGEKVGIVRSDIQGISYLNAEDCPTSLKINYDGNNVTVTNPYFLNGVNVNWNGAYVTVTNSNTSMEITTELSGETSDGGFVYVGSYKTTIVLNGVNITSLQGAAIDIQCGKRVALDIKKDTENTLVDAENGSQKAALYCKGHLEIDKAGTLNVTGRGNHAIFAKEYILLKKSSGKINILGAKNDGIHCNQYFTAKGFTVSIKNVVGDGIQTEMETLDDGETWEEDYENGSLQILDGSFEITSTENGGIKTDEEEEETETPKSYKIYVAKTTGTSGGWGNPGGSSYWNNIYLYKSDGTLVAQLTNTVNITGTNGQSLQFYYYDFKQADSGTYYFKSDDYSSMGGRSTYTIKSSTFTGPTSGIDYYYQISNSYSTSGSTRTFTLSSVQETYGGGTVDAEGETYNSTCLKAEKAITISGGTVVLKNTGSMSKSIKAGNSENEGMVTISGGDVTCTISGDMYLSGTDATYCSAVKADKFVGTGGSLTINASTGKAARGISCDEEINISGGTYNITNSCAGYQGTNDSYTAKALTCDKNIILTGGTMTFKMSGTGGKGIKADGTLTIGELNADGPTLTVSTTGSGIGSSSGGGGGGGRPGEQSSTSSSAKAIKALGQIIVNSGNLTVSTSTDGAEGMESKTSIAINGGNHYFKCYDDCINSAGVINFAGGNTACYSNGNDAVDSNYGRSGAITISGGNIFAYSSKGGVEEGLDCDNNSYIVITGGIAVSAGGSQGGGGGWGGSSSQSVGSSSQGYFLGSSPSSYNNSYYYTLCNTSGEAICTYKFEASVSNSLSLLTAPNLGKGSVTVKYGSSAPTSCDAQVKNASGTAVFFVNPTVSTSGTTATVTAK